MLSNIAHYLCLHPEVVSISSSVPLPLLKLVIKYEMNLDAVEFNDGPKTHCQKACENWENLGTASFVVEMKRKGTNEEDTLICLKAVMVKTTHHTSRMMSFMIYLTE